MPEDMSKAESYIPESARSLKSISAPQENIDKFRNIKNAPRNFLNEEETDPHIKEMEAAFINENLEWGSRSAKQDRIAARLLDAETPQEVAPCIEALRRFESWDFQEAINSYRFQSLLGLALDNWEAYKLSHEDIISNGIVKGEIDKNGYIKNGGEMRFKGYEVRIEKEKIEIKQARRKGTYEEDENGEKINNKNWVEWEIVDQILEKPCFESEINRFALAEANKQLMQTMIVGQKLHQETGIFDAYRAALEEQVKLLYTKQIGLTNSQFEWFFRAADIDKITPEKRENRELGEKRDKAMRIMRLVGMSETKEKMEDFLNKTFVLEMILDNKTTDRVLDLAGSKITKMDNENDIQYFERKFIIAAKFLIGDGLKINYEKKTNSEGNKEIVRQYRVDGWLSAEERGVNTNVFREYIINGENKKHKKGADAIKFETDVLKVRGFVTADGNTFSRGERDLQSSMLGKLSLLIGDEFAVRDADRMMWTRGGKDELGPEFYAFKHTIDRNGGIIYSKDQNGNLIPDLPTGEELIEAWNKYPNDEEWAKWAKPILKRFSLPGEPVGSDLSKIFWTYLYRLKDQLNERPTGLLLSTDKVPRLAQSLFSLARTSVQTTYLNKEGDVVRDEDNKILKINCPRSIYEQWEGFKGDKYLAIEKPINLGNFEWNKVRAPEEIEEVVVNERRNASSTEEMGVANEKVWNLLGVSNDIKLQIVKDHGGNENKALEFMIGKTYATDEGGVGDNADGFYKLLNFLAGDGNEEKRPWAYLTKTKIDPKNLIEPDTYTAKKKFLQIIFGAGGAFGDYRKYDRQASQAYQNGQKITADDLIKAEANINVVKTQKAWYSSLRSSTSYPTWAFIPYKMKVGRNSKEPSILEVIEGYGSNPGLAVKYGFIDKGTFNDDLPEIRMKI
jgi:hypothetical protein